MITVHTIAELREHVWEARKSGKKVGFVPTMGNLHAGHMSLVQAAKQHCEFVVSSIFINPMQFNDPDDLARYPKTLPDDQEKLASNNCDLLFAPNADEMYPHGLTIQSQVSVPEVSKGMCGDSRPGHFTGVATVVAKLFNLVQADIGFFGQKDYQQLAVIRQMVRDLCFPIKIVGVETERASSGLALSSRNGYLSAAELTQSPTLYQCLQDVAQGLQQGINAETLINSAKNKLQENGFKPDYFEIRRTSDLKAPIQGDKSLVLLAAAFLGSARLIDNLEVDLNSSPD